MDAASALFLRRVLVGLSKRLRRQVWRIPPTTMLQIMGFSIFSKFHKIFFTCRQAIGWKLENDENDYGTFCSNFLG